MKRPANTHRQLKHWFVPHWHNDHRPHLIRAHGLVVMLALVLGVQATAFTIRPANASGLARSQAATATSATGHTTAETTKQGSVLAYATDINVPDLVAQTNQQRADNGLPPLRLDSRLVQSANLKAQNMFAEDYWAHVSPSGIQPWYWFQQAGYNYSYAGENLAKDFDTTAGAVAGWMNSPGHRANILNANYTDVGFAVVNGTLVGGETTLIVAHYGATPGVAVTATVAAPTPRPVVATPAPTPAPTPIPTVAPTPTPLPTPTPTPPQRPAVHGQITEAAPAPKSYSLFAPLALTSTLTWQTLVTIVLLLVLFGVYLATHLTVWRKGLKRWRSSHYRLYAATQISGLAIIILTLATSGLGHVG